MAAIGRKRITTDTGMDELISRHPEVIPVLYRNGMLCVGCLLSSFHDISDAALEHDLDEQQLLREIREVVDTETDGRHSSLISWIKDRSQAVPHHLQ